MRMSKIVGQDGREYVCAVDTVFIDTDMGMNYYYYLCLQCGEESGETRSKLVDQSLVKHKDTCLYPKQA